MQTAVNPWSFRSLLCLIYPLSASPLLLLISLPPPPSSLHCSRLCSFSPMIQAMRETPALPLATSPHPPPITQEQSLLVPPPALFFLHLFLLTLPSSSYSIFLLILCHLTPPPPPCLHLSSPSLSRPSFLFCPCLITVTQSLAAGCLPLFLFLSPHPLPSLSPFASTVGLRENMSFYLRKADSILCVCLNVISAPELAL